MSPTGEGSLGGTSHQQLMHEDLDIDSHMGGIVVMEGKAVRVLDAPSRAAIKIRNSIDVLHMALNLWSEQRTDEIHALLVSEGKVGDPKFEKLC